VEKHYLPFCSASVPVKYDFPAISDPQFEAGGACLSRSLSLGAVLRKVILIAVFACVLVGAFAGSALLTAWQIRNAVRTGDVATLEAKVDWASVRQSLKSSVGETRRAIREIADSAGQPKPGIWERLKAAALPFLSDPLIDRYVTPEGVAKLYQWRRAWQDRQSGAIVSSPASGAGVSATRPGAAGPDRGSLWRRVVRLALVSPVRFEIELADTLQHHRRWFAALEFRSFGWVLTEMKIVEAFPDRPKSLEAGSARLR
jgi:hypothetical protein